MQALIRYSKELILRRKSKHCPARLRVSDNGKGLPAPSGKTSGMGMKIMDYRARLIGGELQVANNPGGEGVTVTCTFRQEAAASPARSLESSHAAFQAKFIQDKPGLPG